MNVTKDKGKYYILIKRSTHHEDTAILNVSVSKNRASKFVRRHCIVSYQ